MQTWERQKMTSLFNRFLSDDNGAAAIEYALIAGIIGVGIIAGLQNLKGGLTGAYSGTANQFNSIN